MKRRDFIKAGSAAAAASSLSTVPALAQGESQTIDFKGPDSLFHGLGWESLNPGYWQIKDNMLRRRLKNYGDRARGTGFPFHYETHKRNGGVMPVDYVRLLAARGYFMLTRVTTIQIGSSSRQTAERSPSRESFDGQGFHVE